MQIARVVGDLTATQKHPSHLGQKLLLVQVIELDGSPRGNPVVAVDAVNAGIGDRVLLVQDGYAAMTAVERPNSPIDFAVLGVVDHVELATPASPAAPDRPPARRKRDPKTS